MSNIIDFNKLKNKSLSQIELIDEIEKILLEHFHSVILFAQDDSGYLRRINVREAQFAAFAAAKLLKLAAGGDEE